MNVVVENLPNCLANLRVEVEPAKVAEARESVTREFTSQARIPGYRPGKAPRSVIEKRFKKQIQDELERKLLSESTRRAISEQNLRVLQLANFEDVKFSDADQALSFTATVVTHPDFALPEYKGIEVRVKQASVSDEDVEKALEELRESASDFSPITEERGAQMEDYIVVDYTGTIEGAPVHEKFPKAGKPLSGNQDFWIKMTDEAFFPGFCQQLVDVKPGESRSFSIEVPSDFPVEGMPGQKIDYEVTLKSIMQKTLPELNDEFANSIVAGKTADDLKALTRDQLEWRNNQNLETSKRNQIMRHLLSWVECELPQNLVRNETQRILSEIVRENQSRGVADEVLKESEKQIVGTAAQSAREKLKGTFILLRIAEKEGLKATREEIFGRVAQMAQRYEMSIDKMMKELDKRNALDQIQEEIITGKALEFLVKNATIVEGEEPAETAGAEAAAEAAHDTPAASDEEKPVQS